MLLHIVPTIVETWAKKNGIGAISSCVYGDSNKSDDDNDNKDSDDDDDTDNNEVDEDEDEDDGKVWWLLLAWLYAADSHLHPSPNVRHFMIIMMIVVIIMKIVVIIMMIVVISIMIIVINMMIIVTMVIMMKKTITMMMLDMQLKRLYQLLHWRL